MMVFSKENYEDDGRIMKAARKQQYIMFPAPISFLDDELKAELGMKKKEKEKEEETSDNYWSLKVPIDHTDKESKTYTVKVKRYDSGPPEEFLKWRLILAEQVKNNGYGDNADNSMNLAQAMLAGRSLEAFLNKNAHKKPRTKCANQKWLQNIHLSKSMTSLYSNFQFERLTSKVDGAMPTRGRESTWEDIFSWGDSIRRSSVKDCNTQTGTWITSQFKKQVTATKSLKHMAKACPNMS
jgi:hypothetical protein